MKKQRKSNANAKIHNLNVLPEYFKDLLSGVKTFEVRKNDRDYQPGDILVLQEYKIENKEYTGEELSFRVTYILRDFEALHREFVILALEDLRIGCKCRKNQKTGLTPVPCCNTCGKPEASFWFSPDTKVRGGLRQ